MARCVIRTCRKEFVKRSMTHKACSPECAAEYAKQQRLKKEAKEHRARKLAIKPRSAWMREAQAEFNAFIRERDKALPCISCGRFHTGQYHAGHYLSTGARPELRFEPMNVWKQCQPCNMYLSGNLVLYRVALVEKIGIENVEWLEGNHAPKKYTIADLKSIRDEYRLKLKELRNASI